MQVFRSFFNTVSEKHNFLLIMLAIAMSIGAWYIAHITNLTLAYNDAMSHVNIARLVIDNQEPGLSQIGSVWLPLNHILPIIFVWNDWAWRTGLAASIFSMLSYVVSLIAIYQTVHTLSKKRIAAFIGALAFGFNFNMLYLQATPLTEPLYVALFSLSVLFFTKYIVGSNAKLLPLLGFLGFLQVICRYDGWFVVVVMGLLLFVNEWLLKKHTLNEAIGKILLYGFPVGLGIGIWFLWNALIFGDPLFFVFGPYSARAQQQAIESATELITKGNIVTSVAAYVYAIRDNVGIFVSLLSLAGAFVFLFLRKTTFAFAGKGLVFALLLAPIAFNILALFLGFSILNLPELGWNPSGSPEGYWFNVRYGILALPFAAVLVGIFAGWRKLAAIIAFEIIVLQSIIFATSGIITVVDGTIGSSAFRNTPASSALAKEVRPDDTVLISLSAFNPVVFQSNIPLHQFIHEGVSRKWNKALVRPNAYATIVVMSKNNAGEPVREAMFEKKNKLFQELYQEVYNDNELVIYRLINS